MCRCHSLEVRLAAAEKQAANAKQEAESQALRAKQLGTHLQETKVANTRIMNRVADLEEYNSKNDSNSAMVSGLQQQLIDVKQRLFAEEKRNTALEVQCRELTARLTVAVGSTSTSTAKFSTVRADGNSATQSAKPSEAFTAGECMALRRQVEVLTRQVTQLEDANAKLALIKTSQVCVICSPPPPTVFQLHQ